MGNRSSVNSTHSRLRDTRIHIAAVRIEKNRKGEGKEVAEGMEWKDARNKWSFPRGGGGVPCSNSSNKVSDAPGRSLAFISADRESTLSSSRDAVAHAVNPRVNHVHELILQPDPVFFVVRCPYRGPLNYSTDIIDCLYIGAGPLFPALIYLVAGLTLMV